MARRRDIQVEIKEIKTLEHSPFYLFVLFLHPELQPNPFLLARRGRLGIIASVVKLERLCCLLGTPKYYSVTSKSNQFKLFKFTSYSYKKIDMGFRRKVIICFLIVSSFFELQQVSILHITVILLNKIFNASKYPTRQKVFGLLIHLQDKSL